MQRQKAEDLGNDIKDKLQDEGFWDKIVNAIKDIFNSIANLFNKLKTPWASAHGVFLILFIFVFIIIFNNVKSISLVFSYLYCASDDCSVVFFA